MKLLWLQVERIAAVVTLAQFVTMVARNIPRAAALVWSYVRRSRRPAGPTPVLLSPPGAEPKVWGMKIIATAATTPHLKATVNRAA